MPTQPKARAATKAHAESAIPWGRRGLSGRTRLTLTTRSSQTSSTSGAPFDTLVDELEEERSRADDLETELQRLQGRLDELCSAIDNAYYAANSAVYDALVELSLSC